MEIFVFPELMYSLVLANIMSPIVWKWRDQDCFKKLDGKSPYKKLMRLKQFIMDEFEFNLDLETWGLTNRNSELDRFKGIISPEVISQSNALFGYHGDSYYFDVDIRKHFGLDKYDSDIIPYWKTETLEAMDAFRYKQGYATGAGECVSLAALYAAAAFVVCQIRLEDIFMILTPLHSQNFIDIQDGVITNNRRITTKTMWFNGTEISLKAQRALRNERITVVAHNTGFIHTVYEDANIDLDSYEKFKTQLGEYLYADINLLNIVNFLRTHSKYQKYFQFCRHYRGTAKFVTAETMFRYEHGSQFRIADDTYDKLLEEVDEEDYYPSRISERICCEQLRQFLNKKKFHLQNKKDLQELRQHLESHLPDAGQFVADLADYLTIEPKLPEGNKNFIKSEPINITIDMDRQQIIDYLVSIRKKNTTADLAFYAYRDMDNCDWQPFIKAALERNPVSIEQLKVKNIEQIYDWLISIENISIYDSNRLAQPDEVVNFLRGDGIEKALLLANIIKERQPDMQIKLDINKDGVLLIADKDYQFVSSKHLIAQIEL